MSELQNNQKLADSLIEMDSVVFKDYLNVVEKLPVIPLGTDFDHRIMDIRLRKISRIIYDTEEDTLDKINNIFSSLYSHNSNIVIIIKSTPEHVDFYIGTKKIGRAEEAGITLESAIQGNFPGLTLDDKLVAQDIEKLLKPILSKKINTLISVAGVPSLKNESRESFSQGLDKLIDSMRGREYTAIIQGSPIPRYELDKMEVAYQDIYTALATFESQQISLSSNESRAVGIALSEGITTTLSKSIANTQTKTVGTNTSYTTSESQTQSSFDIKRVISQGVSGAISGGIAAGAVSGGIGAPLGALAGGVAGIGLGLFGGSETSSTNNTSGTNSSDAEGITHSDSESFGQNSNETKSDTVTIGTTHTLQVTQKNRRITTLLSSIDNQLERIEECKSYGMWLWGAYFISQNEVDARLGADIYAGVLRGASTGLERNNIAVWNRHNDESKFKQLQSYLAQLKHPLFQMPDQFITQEVSHTSLISTSEMAVAMSLPRKSLPGLPVYEAASFGRSTTRIDSSITDNNISIGSVSHFGVIDKNLPVELDVKSLTGHAFITGSTGSGKSNAVYSIVETLYSQKKIPFLIIEPAKGEYKEVFGGYKEVNVFGINPQITSLLRVNPFSFPENIHVMEHIDRFIEILNAVWPMYAAMPAILKDAVEQTYERCGWDLLNSVCKYGNQIFPDFHDLLTVLPDIINQSEYSQEMKGNYAGALLTRVKSLTNGYFKTIFQKDELNPQVLFDQPCIIDLSRGSSMETKALLMGVIFLKLQEYRISCATKANADLKHITVIEEAHNLLRRTSGAQSEDSSNLQGKSVEMISNAIAEMRTYGEGFIIADQAPGLLDMSAIRNTNTKIILRLPDLEDRNLVGKSARLNDEQIEELARLPTGCAAVYQSNWLEPVLCQFDIFAEQYIKPYSYQPEYHQLIDRRAQAKHLYIKSLLTLSLNLKKNNTLEIDFPISLRPYYPDQFLNKRINNKLELSKIIAAELNLNKLLDKVSKNSNINIWLNDLIKEIHLSLDINDFDKSLHDELFRNVFAILSLTKPENRKIFEEQMLKITLQKGNAI